jgi:hypothetical protein
MLDRQSRLSRQAKMRLVNLPMRRILALPFSTPLSKRLMLLYLTGRRSGRSYRQPVSYVKDGDSLLTPGGGNWKLNLEPGRPERIRLDGRGVTARPDLIDDIDQIDTALSTMTAANPRIASFIRHGPARRWPLRARWTHQRCRRWIPRRAVAPRHPNEATAPPSRRSNSLIRRQRDDKWSRHGARRPRSTSGCSYDTSMARYSRWLRPSRPSAQCCGDTQSVSPTAKACALPI